MRPAARALFAYAVLKGVRLGYLPKRMARPAAEKAFYGTCDKLSGRERGRQLCSWAASAWWPVSAASDPPRRLVWRTISASRSSCNDAKGVGPLLLAYTEILAAQKQ